MKVDMPRDCGLQSPDFKISPENVQLVNVGGEEAINLIRMLSNVNSANSTKTSGTKFYEQDKKGCLSLMVTILIQREFPKDGQWSLTIGQ